MLTAEQRETIRRARDEQARDRAKRTRRIEDQLERDMGLREVVEMIADEELPQENGASAEWTRTTVIDKLLRWRHDFGSFPSSVDWQRRNEGFPTYSDVRKFFDGWADAIAAAQTRYETGDYGGQETKPAAEPPRPLTPPSPALDPPVDPVGENPSLTDLAEELEAAQEDRESAQARFDAALERFREHPLVADLV